MDFKGESLGFFLDAQGRQAGANSMVLQRDRRTEDRHDAVAGELVHGPAIPLHHRRRTVGQLRMTRSGNRQLNMALHTIALTQLRIDGPGATYYRKRIAEGDSPGKALRCLKRHLCRVVFRCLHSDHDIDRRPETTAAL